MPPGVPLRWIGTGESPQQSRRAGRRFEASVAALAETVEALREHEARLGVGRWSPDLAAEVQASLAAGRVLQAAEMALDTRSADRATALRTSGPG